MTVKIRNSLTIFFGAAMVMLAVTATPVHAMGEGYARGIPFSAVLDSNGEVLAGGFMKGRQNIGYPATDEEIKAFLAMLTTAAEKMTQEEQDILAQSLRKARPKKH